MSSTRHINLDKNKVINPEAKIFRHLRMSAGLKTRDLAKLMECSNSLVTHFETGRNPLPENRVRQLCKIFKINTNVFEEYKNGTRTIPIDYRTECLLIINKLDKNKLQAVYGILSTIT